MCPMTDRALPKDFLSTPATDITVSRIDFARTSLYEYKDLFAIVLDNALTLEECHTLINAAEACSVTADSWHRATVNAADGGQTLSTEDRNCSRLIYESPSLVAKIWDRIAHLPEVREITRLENAPHVYGRASAICGETWMFTRPNEQMRFLKYVGGEYFRPHMDGNYTSADGKERSFYTLHIYLNGPPSEIDLSELGYQQRLETLNKTLAGGATTFHSVDMFRKYDVHPRLGRILLFQQRDLLHSGEDVLRGIKYTIRTDLMFTLVNTRARNDGTLDLDEKSADVEEAMANFDSLDEA